MMRFSRRRSSLSFSSSAVKTALNANHAGAFLQHSAVPCSSETTWSRDTNALKPKRDESWTEWVSVCVIDRFPEITGEHRCSENGEKPNQCFPIFCRSICWGLSSVSVKIEMQQTPSACTTFTSNELSLLELWMLFFSQCFAAAKFVFFKMNDSGIMGL